MSLEDRLRREPSEKVNDAGILFSQVVGGKLLLYNHKPLVAESGDRVMDLFSCVAEKPVTYNAPVRIQSKIYPMNVFKVAKEWKDCIAVLLSMARTGNGNANAVVYMAQEKENESFSGGIEEMSVLKLFSAERTTVTDDQLAVAVASMGAWVAVKKKGRGGRRVEAEMRATAAAAKERGEVAEKEKKEASEREQAKALKEKEKAEKKAAAEMEKEAAAADDDDDDAFAETLEKVRWAKAIITPWTKVKAHCNKKPLLEIVCRTLKLKTRQKLGDGRRDRSEASVRRVSVGRPAVIGADAGAAAAAAVDEQAAAAAVAPWRQQLARRRTPSSRSPRRGHHRRRRRNGNSGSTLRAVDRSGCTSRGWSPGRIRHGGTTSRILPSLKSQGHLLFLLRCSSKWWCR